jgi:enoyl-CoA hydratase/carnithine racemase
VSDGFSAEPANGLLRLRLERPPRNLLDPELMSSLRMRLDEADAEDAVRAIVVTGSGATFCGGLDVAAIQGGADPVEFARELVALLRVLPTLGKPVVAAVNGDALASGFSIVCACDLAVAADGAKLGTFEASIGIWPMIAQVPPLQRLLPRHALQNAITGIPFDAEEALRIGAVNRVVPAAQVDAAAAELAEQATSAGSALAVGRRSFYRFLDLSYDEALDAALHEFTSMFTPREGT